MENDTTNLTPAAPVRRPVPGHLDTLITFGGWVCFIVSFFFLLAWVFSLNARDFNVGAWQSWLGLLALWLLCRIHNRTG